MFLKWIRTGALTASVTALASICAFVSACTRNPSKPPDGTEAGGSRALPAAAELTPETPALPPEARPDPDPPAQAARQDPLHDAGSAANTASESSSTTNNSTANDSTANEGEALSPPALLPGCEPRPGESQRWFYPDELLRRAPGAVWKPGAFQGKLRALFRWTDRARGLACIRIDVLTAGPEFHRWKTQSPLLRLRLLTLSSGLELVEGARLVRFDKPEADTIYRHSLSVRCTAPDAKSCSEGTLSVAMTYPDTQFEPVVTLELQR